MAVRSTAWVGQTLGERYTVTALLGEGGMGFVYRARDVRLEGDVVIKVPRAELLADVEFRTRFQDEIRALVRMNHPHVVKVTDTGRHEGLPYAVMQFLPGGSLDDCRPRTDDGRIKPMKVRSIKEWLPAVADALDYIHAQGYIHRDIKPANILFDAARNAYISDFGVAKAAGDTNRPNLTGAGMIVGTAEYVAPEIVHGKPFDGRADQYALGVMAYELLAGVQPFTGSSPMAVLIKHINERPVPLCQVRDRIPPALSAVVMRALARDPAGRYQSCAAFAATAVVAADEPTGNYGVAKPTTPTAPWIGETQPLPREPRRRTRPSMLIVGISAVCLALGLGLALTNRGRTLPSAEPVVAPQQVQVPDSQETATGRIERQELQGTVSSPSPSPSPLPKEITDKSPPSTPRPSKSIDLGAGGSIEFALIPAGRFQMGTNEGTGPATPAHMVLLEKQFYLGKHEVTRRAFRAFVEAEKYVTYAEREGNTAEGWNAARGELERSTGYSWRNPGFEQDDDHPVVCVTKSDARAFRQWVAKDRNERFTMPTEAQWEFACRANRPGPFAGAMRPEEIHGAANVLDRSLGARLKPPGRGETWDDGYPFTSPIGKFRANAFGLFDMHGNVAEWCLDVARDYKKPPSPDHFEEDVYGAKHVVRGGSWNSPAVQCAAFERELLDDSYTASCRIGFRLAITIEQ
ncbi:MAG: bifunctional serine/threonine-protein kinase/formylglycine-generating enzyme family protein [Gemmataceae bacterium]